MLGATIALALLGRKTAESVFTGFPFRACHAVWGSGVELGPHVVAHGREVDTAEREYVGGVRAA